MNESDDLFPNTGSSNKDEPFVPPPLPEPFQIPQEYLEHWFGIDPGTNVTTHLSRADFDNLFASINQSALAIGFLQQSLVEFSNGRIRSADERLSDSRQAVAHSHNAVRMLFASIMRNAVPTGAEDDRAE